MNQGCNGKLENIYGVLQGGPNLFKRFLEDLPDYLNAEKGKYILEP